MSRKTAAVCFQIRKDSVTVFYGETVDLFNSGIGDTYSVYVVCKILLWDKRFVFLSVFFH